MVIFLDPDTPSVVLTYPSERLRIAPVVTFASTGKLSTRFAKTFIGFLKKVTRPRGNAVFLNFLRAAPIS